MSNRKLRKIVVLGTIVIAGLLIVQLFWFKRAFDIRDKQFNHTVQIAIKNIADSLVEHEEQYATIHQLSNGFFFAEINTPIDPARLNHLLQKEFSLRNLSATYEVGIYKALDDTLINGMYIPATIEKDSGSPIPEKQAPIPLPKSNFAIFFPNKATYLAGELKIWIFSTAVMLLVIFFFVYAISSLLREKKLSEVKEDFVNNMTHEFKTPIANIEIAGEVLKSDKLDATKKGKYLDIILHENKRLRDQVNKILSMGAIDKDNMALNVDTIDIHELLRKLATNLSLRIKKRSGNIVLALLSNNNHLLADEFHISNALFNIIDNAEKYSPESPSIEVTTQDNEKGILISIADKGIGIKKDFHKHIFDKFFRIPEGNTHNTKGFGLGLFYVKSVIDAHHGMISLRSDYGKGSRFDIFLPAQS